MTPFLEDRDATKKMSYSTRWPVSSVEAMQAEDNVHCVAAAWLVSFRSLLVNDGSGMQVS
jgi:hypothetical protein